ncbi:phosphatase PAP2 family protein [Caulobacter sp.]|uniref:phosphatase PAP2 family protein n=1 Tax=Caulobacter sp. TaxID=78 RepID=UPI001B105DAA|nr:phosphatase PAP2 family protein [Caulobacter sp.]MBO9543883.1 phosphatase PAP2 family protein [Caulobacter sp.]
MHKTHQLLNPRTESFALAALLGLGVALAVFQDVADDQDEPDGQASDWKILKGLRRGGDPAQPVGPEWVKDGLTELTAVAGVTVLAGATGVVSGGLLIAGKRREALVLTASFAGALALSEGLKNLFKRGRPPAEYRAAEAVNESFPSGHALLSAATFLSLAFVVAEGAKGSAMRAYALACGAAGAAAVGFSRVYLGVHWANDVLGGWAAGSAWAATCWLLGHRRD